MCMCSVSITVTFVTRILVVVFVSVMKICQFLSSSFVTVVVIMIKINGFSSVIFVDEKPAIALP